MIKAIESAVSSVFREFREFAIKGNMIDMAVGIIIGAAFTGVVNSLVKDIIMPPISFLLAKINFSNLFVVLMHGADDKWTYPSIEAASQAGAVVMNLGSFLNNLISFLITAWAVFILVKFINKLKKAPTPPSATTKKCPFCIMDIPKEATKCPQCTADLK
ncbi:MAG: large conductance mechanosensitive channel protein MscL [Elusimicrobiota bacterium]|jgi:large conductance mechanosensitive channel|nr:large conductance mechanosensitive channel protein MscL [Elusimicrobiota bacterium]